MGGARKFLLGTGPVLLVLTASFGYDNAIAGTTARKYAPVAETPMQPSPRSLRRTLSPEQESRAKENDRVRSDIAFERAILGHQTELRWELHGDVLTAILAKWYGPDEPGYLKNLYVDVRAKDWRILSDGTLEVVKQNRGSLDDFGWRRLDRESGSGAVLPAALRQ